MERESGFLGMNEEVDSVQCDSANTEMLSEQGIKKTLYSSCSLMHTLYCGT